MQRARVVKVAKGLCLGIGGSLIAIGARNLDSFRMLGTPEGIGAVVLLVVGSSMLAFSGTPTKTPEPDAESKD